MNQTKIYLVTSLLILILGSSILFAQPYPLSFKYRLGDVLTYQIEQQDSIKTVNGQILVEDDEHLLLKTTCVINETPPQKPYQVFIKTDTVDIIHALRSMPNLIEKEINQILIKAQEGEFKFDLTGDFKKGRALLTPIVFPITGEPIKINSIWKSNLKNKYKENGKYYAKSESEYVVYDIKTGNQDLVAIIIVSSQTVITGDFQRKDIHLRLTGTYNINNKATHIVYFNINEGHADRIISRNIIKWKVRSKAATISKMIKRKSTIKLVESE